MARDLRVFPLMQIISHILYVCKDVVSDLCCPILLSPQRMGIEMRNNRSVVTLQVNYVVCFGVGTVSSASFVNQHIVQLFTFPARRSEGLTFSAVF